MPEYFGVMFRAVNPLYVDTDLLKIGMRRGVVLDDRITAAESGFVISWDD